jgi:hypothetical protein
MSKQGTEAVTNVQRIIVAIALLLLCAQAPDNCMPAVMSLSGEGDSDVAVLDMHGQWHVFSWQGLAWIALRAPEEKARCIARQLLLGNSSVRSDSAETRCKAEDWGRVMRIVGSDPIIRACGAVPSCSVEDTCS